MGDLSLSTSIAPFSIERREAITTEVARKLLDHLLAGQFDPGYRLPSERQLAVDLGIGRSVVREALKSLTLLGIIEVRQGHGTFLRSTESDLLPRAIEWGLMLGSRRTRDLVEARRYLEGILTALAAERRDEEALDALREQLQTMEGAGQDPAAFTTADVAFHLRIAEASGNETLLQVMMSIRALLQVWISRTVQDYGDLSAIAAEHAPILDAIARRDVQGARDAMEDHLTRAFGRLEGTLTDA